MEWWNGGMVEWWSGGVAGRLEKKAMVSNEEGSIIVKTIYHEQYPCLTQIYPDNHCLIIQCILPPDQGRFPPRILWENVEGRMVRS